MTEGVRYRETQPVGWLWYLVGLTMAAALAATLVMQAEVPVWIALAVTMPLPVVALIAMSRSVVEVTGGPDPELIVGQAHLPLHFISRAAVVPQAAKSRAMGRQFDPAAYLVHHPWVKDMVLVVLDDPDDPTPYWLFSARRPQQVIDALGVSDRA